MKILYHQGADFKAKLAPGRQEDMLASFWRGWPRGQVLLSDELAVLAISKLGLDQIAEDLVCEERRYLPPYVAQSRDNDSRRDLFYPEVVDDSALKAVYRLSAGRRGSAQHSVMSSLKLIVWHRKVGRSLFRLEMRRLVHSKRTVWTANGI